MLCAAYSALSISIGLLFDMYVLSALIFSVVFSLRSKGQVLKNASSVCKYLS